MSTRKASGLGMLMPLLFMVSLCLTGTANAEFSDRSFLGFTPHCTVIIAPYVNAVPISSTSTELFTITVNGNGDNPIIEPGEAGNVHLSGNGISPPTVNITTSGGTAKASLTAPATTSSSTGEEYTATIYVHSTSDPHVHVPRTGETHVIIWKAQIWENGGDITGQTHNTIVGRKVPLVGKMEPDAGLSYAQSWNIPGYRIAGWAASESLGAVAELTDNDLVADHIDYFWVDGGEGRQVTHTIYYGNKSNIATTTFNVKRPTASVTTETNHVAADANYVNGLALHFGNVTDGDQGIKFTQSVTEPTGFTGGDTEWVQIVDATYRARQYNNGDWEHLSGSGLDTEYPYATGTTTDDSPGTVLSDTYKKKTVDDYFTMYLMYIPTGDSIYVPLREVSWFWSGTTTRTGPGTWTLDDDSHSTDPSDENCTTYPEWSSNVKDLTWESGL